ncbi:Lrp/AsnC ligand binding domain-containing protein [Streptomyces sp. NPDC048254]|uniref:Lrp/AsnC ligand binding domain-containing protein n=1 Tax=Streptomyces sp. NPDC048254 TaxID=3365525 RepID=UPI00370F8B85
MDDGGPPGGLEETGRRLSRHPQVRFASATTGSANLLVAAAAADLDALYVFLSETVGALEHVTTIEVTPILTGVNRAGPPGEPVSGARTTWRGTPSRPGGRRC